MNLPDLSPAEIRQRYALMCRSTQSTAGERALPQVQDGLNALDALLDDELRALARQGAPDDFADIYLNMQAELELLREFFAYSALGNKNIVAVGGSFSAGKSSLINTLLGQRLLVTEVDPTTALPCFLLRAEADHISAINHFGQRIELSQDEFLSLTHDEEQCYGSQVSRLLRVAYLGYSQFPWPNLALIDTPGYSKSENQSNHNTDAQRARAQLMNAQAIVWVIDARQGCITEDDLRFLSDMPKTTPVLIALSRADQKAASDIPAIINGIKATLKQRNIVCTNVIPVSARKPKDWPLDGIKQQLADWSRQPRRVRFVENFAEQFNRYTAWLHQQQREASDEQSDLKRMVLMLDDKNTRAAAERLLKASQNRMNTLQTSLSSLEILHSKFKQRLLDVANAAGQDWQSNEPTAEEMFKLGRKFRNAYGVPQDYAQAAVWYRKAAELGHAEAQYELGVLYANGDADPHGSVSDDEEKAAFWFYKASEQGNADAQFKLGEAFYYGNGVSMDDAIAAKWFHKAAEQGNLEAQLQLASMYIDGEGVPEDHKQAAFWFRKAAEQGDDGAQFVLASMYVEGEVIPENSKQAAIWCHKSAEQGNADAQFLLGSMYVDGYGVTEDIEQAAVWFHKAATQDNVEAQCNLGIMYNDGVGVEKDSKQAAAWFHKAAEKGHALAQYNLGTLYAKGQGVPQDDAQAVKWYRNAALQGDADAQLNLGNKYHEGRGVPQDDVQAATWFRKAAEQGNADAQTYLAIKYGEGKGVPQDYAQAEIWFRKAAEQGNTEAEEYLDALKIRNFLRPYGY